MGNTYVEFRVDVHCPGQPEIIQRSYTENTENKVKKTGARDELCALRWLDNE